MTFEEFKAMQAAGEVVDDAPVDDAHADAVRQAVDAMVPL